MYDINSFANSINELMIDNAPTYHGLADKIQVSHETVRLWRNGKAFPSLSAMLRLADYAGCSLEFLVGRTTERLTYTPLMLPPFYDRLREVMSMRHISRYSIVKSTSIYDSYFTNWRKGADIILHTLIVLADYLDCTLDYLVGRDGGEIVQ